jgi:hypothetical protein
LSGLGSPILNDKFSIFLQSVAARHIVIKPASYEAGASLANFYGPSRPPSSKVATPKVSMSGEVAMAVGLLAPTPENGQNNNERHS